MATTSTANATVVVVVPLVEELTTMLDVLESVVGPLETDDNSPSGRVTYRTRYVTARGIGCSIVLALAGKGQERAAATTAMLLEAHQPELVFNIGMAGALSSDVALGDIVVGDEVVNYLANSKAVPAQDGAFEWLPAGTSIRSDAWLVERAAQLDLMFPEPMSACRLRLRNYAAAEFEAPDIVAALKFQLHVGPIASGPTVGAAEAFKRFVLRAKRDYLALDMESSGAAVAAELGGMRRRVRYLTLRGVSDLADEGKNTLEVSTKGAARRIATVGPLQIMLMLLDALPPDTFRECQSAGLPHGPRGKPMELGAVHANLRETCEELLSAASSRDNFLVPLPRLQVPCDLYTTGSRRKQVADAFTVAERFLLIPDSKLLVVLGEFGSGKSDLLRRIARKALSDVGLMALSIDYADLAPLLSTEAIFEAISKTLEAVSPMAALQFASLVAADPSHIVLLIDGFDEFNFSLGVDEPPPDLSNLSPLLKHEIKTVVAARRSITASPDALLRQLDDRGQAKSFGAKSYQILELGPCQLEEVNSVLEHLPDAQASIMEGYLTTGSAIHLDRVRRPLFLQMLMDLPSHLFAEQERFSIYVLYDSYVNMVIERDIQRTLSVMPLSPKRRILRQVAHDMFDAQARRTARATISTVRERVSSEIQLDANRTWVSDASESYNWFADFARSNPLLVEERGLQSTEDPAVAFIHQSIFEFFLTQHFACEFYERGQFGLSDDAHSVRAFDSLLPYFLRSTFGAGYEDELIRLVTGPDTSNLDRLLGFFFLEDSPHILELLGAVKGTYRPFLLRAVASFDSFFMEKIVRYQLVLLDRAIGQALAYVSDARDREVDQDQDIEVHTFAAGQGPTEFLLARVGNPRLRNALPITVYRLGQFGDARAVEPLRSLLGRARDPCLQILVTEAIERIESRG